MPGIHFALEIDSGTAVTDPSLAIVSGAIRIITDRPGYTGGGGGPKWEDDTDNTAKWYEGFLKVAGISNTSRRIDIEVSGDYGNLSGFNFTLLNTSKFWAGLASNSIYLLNRPVQYYIVIDDKFYYGWAGIITNSPYNEVDYKSICKDGFNLLHKPLPPNVISDTNFANATNRAQGMPVPICLGRVPHAELIGVGGDPRYTDLVRIDDTTYTACAAKNYSNLEFNDTTLDLYTLGKAFTGGALANRYLVVATGDNPTPNTENMILITASAATVSDFTRVTLAKPLDNIIASQFLDYPMSGPISTDQWYFQVFQALVNRQISENEIEEFELDDTGFLRIEKFSEDGQVYEAVKNIASSVSESNARVTIISDKIDRDRSLNAQFGVVPTYFKHTAGILSGLFPAIDPIKMLDKDRTTLQALTYYGSGSITTIAVEIGVPIELLQEDVTELYLAFDLGVKGTATNKVRVRFKHLFYDPYGEQVGSTETSGYYPSSSTYDISDTGVDLYMLPNGYYAINGDDGSLSSRFGYTQTIDGSMERLKDFLVKIDSDWIERMRNGTLNPDKIELQIQLEASSSPITGTLEFRQFGFVAVKTINLADDRLFMGIKGEKVGGNSTDNVFRTFQHILETYDGISSADIEYGNVQTYRSDWFIGRQLVDRRDSLNYLKELCRHSFVGMFPTRDNKRGLSAWREQYLPVALHDESTILRGSIKFFKKTPVTKLYNEFELKYSWNPGAGSYDRTIYIKNIEQSSFPIISSNWQDYVGGLHSYYYNEAKVLWERCHEAWVRTASITKLPDSHALLPWFIDQNIYGGEVLNYQSFGDRTTKCFFQLSLGEIIIWYREGTSPLWSTNGLQAGDRVRIRRTLNGSTENHGTFTVLTSRDLVISLDNPTGVSEIITWGNDGAFQKVSVVSRTAEGLGVTGAVKEDAVYRYLKGMVDYVTLQKNIVAYSLPMTADNIVLELLDLVTFSDPIYTNGVQMGGWIVQIDLDAKKGQMHLQVMLEEASLFNEKVKDSWSTQAQVPGQGDDWKDSWATQAEAPSQGNDIEDSWD